jgi:lysozyme family protein
MSDPSERASLIGRRGFGVGIAATAAVLGGLVPGAALAQDPKTELTPDLKNEWAELTDLSARARTLGLSVPVISAAEPGSAKYREIFPAIVDFIDKFDESVARTAAPADEVSAIRKRASDLLAAVHRREKSVRRKAAVEPPPASLFQALAFVPAAQAAPGDGRFEKYLKDYQARFAVCTVRPENKSEVDWYIGKLLSDKYRRQYQAVEDKVCVPWYFVGIVHALEASFNFSAHLHNGDPLDERTVQVPAGMPKVWSPPNDWMSSAVDALTYEKFTNETDWSVERTLYRWEAYNGFRSRELHATASPYLWSFSNQYKQGKFIRDGVWSATTVSKQCGAGVMLKELVNRGEVILPS